jgi:hypothetical protein
VSRESFRLGQESPRAPDYVIWDLVCCFGDLELRSRLLGMFKTYVDDSGRGDPFIFVDAGFLSTAPKWATFSVEWEAELRRHPAIPVFKATEAAHCTGAFTNFTIEQRDARVERLIAIINNYTELAVMALLNTKVYRETFKEKISITMDVPQFHVHISIIRRTIGWHYDTGRMGKIDFYFDEMSDTELFEVRAVWQRMKMRGHSWQRRRLGLKPETRDDKTVLPLQAADLLAWSYYRWMKDLDAGVSETDSLGARWVSMITVPKAQALIDNNEVQALGARMLSDRIRTGKPYETGRERSKRLKPHRSS